MNTITIHLPDEISKALEILNKNGHQAYVVGGAVRDYVMGNQVSDFDITTDATPEEIHKLFDKCVDTGIAHGTVTVIINHTHIEITTFRLDGDYTDHRRPDSVSYSNNLSDDLSRRDFTVNALAYNPKSGIKDIFGGIDDIEIKILKCVGNAEKRFEEDALRMLRLIRFASKLGFDVEKSTLLALIKKEKLIGYVSKERIREEIIKTFLCDYPEKIFLFNKSNILDYVFKTEFFEKITEDTISKIKNLPKNYISRLSLLLYQLYDGDEDNTRKFLSDMKFSNKEKRDIISIVSFISKYLKSPEDFKDKYTFKRALAKYFAECVLYSFDILSEYTDIGDIRSNFTDIEKNKEPYMISHLKINGKILTDIGLSGINTGKCLEHLLNIVTKNPSLNTKEFLIKEAEKFHAEKSLCKD